MKTKEELNEPKEEMEAVSEKLHELTDDEMEQVIGGYKVVPNDQTSWWRTFVDFLFK